MIYPKICQEQWPVNYKRVERLYQQANLQEQRCKRKKVPVGDLQPLYRPDTAKQVWSMNLASERVADGRAIKTLTIVDDATHECVAIEVERAVSADRVASVLDRMAHARGLRRIIPTDNGKEFCVKAMVAWAHERGVQLRLIQPGKPNQNAYIESFQRTARR